MDFNTLDIKSVKLLRELWRTPFISRTELSERTGLDPSAVSRSMGTLVESCLVEEVEEGLAGPQGGRKPVKLRIHPGYGVLIGLEFHSVFCDVVFTSFQGELIECLHIPNANTDDDLIKRLKEVWDRVSIHAHRKGYRLIGMAIGFPGIVDPDKGVLLVSNPLEIKTPVEIAPILKDYSGIPVLIENDVRCCCFAELSHVRQEHPKDFMFILGEFRRNKLRRAEFDGIALGLALVLNGSVFRGDKNAAGEFRSVFYETLQGNAQFAIPDQELIRLEHDPIVQTRFANELGRNLALIVNVLNLPKLVFGGSLDLFGMSFLEKIRNEIEKNWQYPGQGVLNMQYSSYGDHSVAYGAAVMYLFKLFQMERHKL